MGAAAQNARSIAAVHTKQLRHILISRFSERAAVYILRKVMVSLNRSMLSQAATQVRACFPCKGVGRGVYYQFGVEIGWSGVWWVGIEFQRHKNKN